MPAFEWINSEPMQELDEIRRAVAYRACARHENLEHARKIVVDSQSAFDIAVSECLDSGIKRDQIAELLGMSGPAVTAIRKRVEEERART